MIPSKYVKRAISKYGQVILICLAKTKRKESNVYLIKGTNIEMRNYPTTTTTDHVLPLQRTICIVT
jgi:hypothetical protein